MLRPASSEDVPQFAHSVHRDVDRGGLLKQRIVSGVLEDRSDAGVIVDRAGGGDAAGVGRTDDGIAAQRAIAQRPVESVVRVDTDIVDAAPVLSTELAVATAEPASAPSTSVAFGVVPGSPAWHEP